MNKQTARKRSSKIRKPAEVSPAVKIESELSIALQGLAKMATPKQVLSVAIELDYNYQVVRQNLKGHITDEQVARRICNHLLDTVCSNFYQRLERYLSTFDIIEQMIRKIETYIDTIAKNHGVEKKRKEKIAGNLPVN